MSRKYSLWISQLSLAIVFVSHIVWAQSSTDARYVRLLNPYGMNLPALEIVPTNETAYNVDFYRETAFAPGSRFVYLERGGLAEYGYIENGDIVGSSSLMPVVYLHPVDSNGVVNTNVILGMPANFLEFESSNTNLYEDRSIRTFFESCDLDNNYICNPNSTPARGYTTEVYQENLFKTQEVLTYISSLSDAEPEEGALPVPSLALTADVAVDSPGGGDVAAPVRLGEDRPRLSYGEVAPEAVADETPQAPRQPAPAEESPADVAPVAAAVAAPLDPNNYNNDPVLRNMIELRLTERLQNPLIRRYGETGDNVFRSDTSLPANTRFILVPNEPRKSTTGPNGEKIYYRVVYGVSPSGQIATNSEGQRAYFYIPEALLEYYDPESREIKPVTRDSNLVRAVSDTVVEPEVAADETAAEAPVAEVEASEEEAAVVPAVVEPPAEASPEVTNLSMCSNRAFARQYGTGSGCYMVEIENFQLVKSQLMRNLDSNVLTNNLVIAVDSTTNMCSHISLAKESYTDYSEYNQSLTTSFNEIRSALQSVPMNQRLGEAFPGAPTESRFTYSCERDKSACRFSYDHYLPETMRLRAEITNPSSDFNNQQTLRVYGPDSMNRYMVQYVRGSEILRTVVFEDNPGLILNGTIGSILSQMDDYSDLQSDREGTESEGHFITSTTYDFDGQKVTQSERIGTPEALSLISRIRNSAQSPANPSAPATSKKFYRLACSGSSEGVTAPVLDESALGAE